MFRFLVMYACERILCVNNSVFSFFSSINRNTEPFRIQRLCVSVFNVLLFFIRLRHFTGKVLRVRMCVIIITVRENDRNKYEKKHVVPNVLVEDEKKRTERNRFCCIHMQKR